MSNAADGDSFPVLRIIDVVRGVVRGVVSVVVRGVVAIRVSVLLHRSRRGLLVSLLVLR